MYSTKGFAPRTALEDSIALQRRTLTKNYEPRGNLITQISNKRML